MFCPVTGWTKRVYQHHLHRLLWQQRLQMLAWRRPEPRKLGGSLIAKKILGLAFGCCGHLCYGGWPGLSQRPAEPDHPCLVVALAADAGLWTAPCILGSSPKQPSQHLTTWPGPMLLLCVAALSGLLACKYVQGLGCKGGQVSASVTWVECSSCQPGWIPSNFFVLWGERMNTWTCHSFVFNNRKWNVAFRLYLCLEYGWNQPIFS